MSERHGSGSLFESRIVAAAKSSFLQGDEWAYIAGIVAILLGAALILFLFPTKEREAELLDQYHAEDVSETAGPARRSASAARALR
jgi:DHA2 family multidrug resistance protein-like MFS transporter